MFLCEKCGYFDIFGKSGVPKFVNDFGTYSTFFQVGGIDNLRSET